MGDSPTPPWFPVAGATPTKAVDGETEVEGPAPVPALAVCEAMRRSIWACCLGVKTDVSTGTQSGQANGVDVGMGNSDRSGDRMAEADEHGASDAKEGGASGTLLSPGTRVKGWARRWTSSCELSP